MCVDGKFGGAFTAIVTPFTKDATSIDISSLKKLIEFQISSGIHGLVACGSTGEGQVLTSEESYEVVKTCMSVSNKKIPIIGSIGTNDTSKAIQTASALRSLSVDGILVVSPPYNKPPQRGIVEHFRAIKKASSLPIILYNIPGRTAVNIHVSTIQQLVNEGVVQSIKESSGSFDQVMDTIFAVGDKASVLSGEDALVAGTLASGGQGVITAVGNVLPSEFASMCDYAKNQDFESVKKIQLKILPFIRLMFQDTNPIPVKCALKEMGIIQHDSLRLPLVSAEDSLREKIQHALTSLSR